jgi:hypothetical protein
MTSVPLAEPRPPPQLPRPPGPNRPVLARSASYAVSPGDRRPSGLQRQASDVAEDRAAKRRKIEGDLQSNTGFFQNNAIPVPKPGETQTEDKTASLRWIKPSALRLTLSSKPQVRSAEEAATENDVPDLPTRPWKAAQAAKVPEEPKPSHRSRVHVPVPNTPDSMPIPTSVPHFVSTKPAGFFPWTGKHPEDVLNDANVKSGYFDKPPNPTEKELNTARVPLYNAFKHKSGVDSLSIFFSLVLDQQTQHGTISSVSTFKPPPRVTLTEMKRKSWISDLANAEVPLRRLSRTIPQGIRGQALLDQCLQSNVPSSRAIWFAKCVCANEIRTLKRKGTAPAVAVGTESKWLREWTINVEQFLESHLAQIASPDWRSNIQYAIRLNTRLYLENLLDREHYLDWVLRSFASADTGHTPFWLMITHIHKHDLTQYRRKGSRLIQTLLDKFRALGLSPEPRLLPLWQKIRAALREFLFARPALFLMAEQWPENVKYVRACLALTIQVERRLFDTINRVNERAMGHNKNDVSSIQAPDQAVVDVLDAAKAPYNIDLLDHRLKSACSDFDLRMQTCLEWSCTHFRHSTKRIYLVARLVKRWQREGYDVDNAVLGHLSAYKDKKTTDDPRCLRHLVAQLSRVDCLTPSRYMQWLIVRGLPKKGTIRLDTNFIFGPTSGAPQAEDLDPAQFLLNLSLNKAENHVINLRRSVLERAGFDCDTEDAVYQQCIRFIEQKLNELTSTSYPKESKVTMPAFASLPWTLRTRISFWIRTRAIAAAQAAQTAPALPGSKILNEGQFFLIRHILENMDDEAILADVVGILSGSPNDDLIASLVATIHAHADVFASIGALEPLQKRMCQVYLDSRATKPTMPLLTSSLLDLCSAYPTRSPTLKLLQQDLVRGDRGRAIAACSPYSDGIAESLQQAGSTFAEDFEAILQSETNMNEQTMNGLFSVLVDRIEKQQKFEDDPRVTFSFCQLLSRLRLCRRNQGDLLIQRWIGRLLPRLDSKWGPLLLQDLVATGCLGFPGLLQAVAASKQGARRNVAFATLLYQILAPAKGMSLNWPTFQTQTKWYEYSQSQPQSALEIVCEAGLQGVSVSFDSKLLSVLVDDSRTTSSAALSASARQWLAKSLGRLAGGNDTDASKTDIRALFQAVNIFSHRYVQLRLATISQDSAEKTAVASLEEMAEVLYATLKQTMQSSPADHGDDQRFAQFLRTLGSDVATLIRHKVEAEFLEALPKLPPGKATSPLTAVFPNDAQLDAILERSVQVCRKDTVPSPGFVLHLIDRFSQFFKSLGHAPGLPSTPLTTAAPVIPGLNAPQTGMPPPPTGPAVSTPGSSAGDGSAGACQTASTVYLRFLLRMVCLQRPGIIAAGRAGPNTKQGQSEQVQLLVRLASIAMHPAMVAAMVQSSNKEQQETARDVIQFIFDIIATIVDEVSDEVSMMCARLLKDKLQDGRLRYSFGSVNILGSEQIHDMGQGLQLVKEGKGVIGDWKPRMWEVLDNGSGKESETSLGLGLFGARYGQ